uniref:Ferric reductase-like protein n=1 Tax=uncultured bacterium pAB4 TaxID=1444979 RepID=W5VJK1_9BACT|nr:ferric reductase-like protein [uncultured bacterium pAB4]
MFSPIIISILMVIAYYLTPQILKYRKQLYIAVWFILAAIIALRGKQFVTPFVKGYVGFAFFYVVMITGALNPKWKLTKKLRSVRAPYSILGFVLLMSHPLNYMAEVLSKQRDIPYFGVAAFLIMVPLFITSYLTIRKKMKAQSWVKLQRWAYPVYALILVHLVVNASTPQNRIVAILLFIPYIGLKLHKEFIVKQKVVSA